MTNITVDVETAKKLKELGRKKETYFMSSPQGGEICPVNMIADDYIGTTLFMPTAQELLDVLPEQIWGKDKKEVKGLDLFRLTIKKTPNSYRVRYGCTLSEGHLGGKFFLSANLANALAELWIWCKENGHLSLTDADD